jgi:hypothetical protein
MKILRWAVLGAGAAWFMNPSRGAERRARVLDALRGFAGRAQRKLEGSGLAPTSWTIGQHGSEGRARRPVVEEVKSPAELEPGVFSASPRREPGRRGAMPHGALPDELEPTAADWENDDVTPRVDLVEPPLGSHLTEAHLGVYVPREDVEAPARGLRASDDDAASETERGVPPVPER